MTGAEIHQKGQGPSGIEVQCLACGRIAAFDAGDGAIAGEPLVALTRRFRCSACGSRAVRARRAETPRDLARRMKSRS